MSGAFLSEFLLFPFLSLFEAKSEFDRNELRALVIVISGLLHRLAIIYVVTRSHSGRVYSPPPFETIPRYSMVRDLDKHFEERQQDHESQP